MTRCLILLAVTLWPAAAVAADPVAEVRAAHQLTAWDDVSYVAFTWKHKSGAERSYRWWVNRHVVRVHIDGAVVDVPVSGRGLKTDAERSAHKAFVNDSFWLLFEHHLMWDEPQIEDLGEFDSPFGGTARAFRASYPAQGGYTPGDAYIAFIGQDGKVMGWSYVPAGATKAKLTTLRGSYLSVGGLVLPTRFETPDGQLFIEITDLVVR